MKLTAKDDSWKAVTGKTVIDHQVRVKLGLTFDEYIVADCLHTLLKKQVAKVLFNKTFPMSEHVLKETGQNELDWWTYVMKQLIAKNIIIVEETDVFRYAMTPRWLQEFDVSADFEVFWNDVYKKHGNKATAIEKYSQARKLVDKDILHERAKKYISTRDDFPQYTKAAEVWLNPKKRHWEDVLPGDDEAPPEQTEGVLGKQPD